MTGAYFSASAVLVRIDLLYPLAVEAADATQDAADTRAYVPVMNEKELPAALKQLTRQLVGERAPMSFIARWRPNIGHDGDELAKLGLVLNLLEKQLDATARVHLDEPCAEIIDGAESVWDILGAPQDIATATEETLLSVVPQEVFKNGWSGWLKKTA